MKWQLETFNNKNNLPYDNCKRINNCLLVEYYIQSNWFYNLCPYQSIDERKFGFFYNCNKNIILPGFYLIRELNENYFLISRIDKINDDSQKEDSLNILPVMKDEFIELWYAYHSDLLLLGVIDKGNETIEIIDNKILKNNNTKKINLIINEKTLDIKYEKLIFYNYNFNQRFSICRIPSYFDFEKVKLKENKHNDYCILNSYNGKHIDECLKVNLLKSNANLKINSFRPINLSYSLNDYIDNHSNIIYYGHGYSSEKYLKLDLNKTENIEYSGKKSEYHNWFMFLACNESNKNYIAEYNSIISLFKSGFMEILVTDSKVILDEIVSISPILIILCSLSSSIAESVKLLSRLNMSIIPLSCPFRVYVNPIYTLIR